MKEKDLIRLSIEQNMADKERIRKAVVSENHGGKPPKMQKTKKRGARLAVLASAAVVVVTLVCLLTIFVSPADPDTAVPKSLSSYSKIYDVIDGYYQQLNRNYVSLDFGWKARSEAPTSDGDMATPPTAPSDSGKGDSLVTDDSAESSGGGSHSNTNVQTEGLDEGDIVKCDDKYIYKLNTKGCFIIAANNGNMSVASSITVDNYVPEEMYVLENTLVMIGGIAEIAHSYNDYGDVAPLTDCISYIQYSKTDIRIYDITDRTNPVLKRNLTFDGTYFTSRLSLEDGRLIYILNYHFNYSGDREKFIPSFYDSESLSGLFERLPVENIFYYDDIPAYSYLIMGTLDVNNPEKDSDMTAYLGLNGTIYVSTDNIFISSYDSYRSYKTNAFGMAVRDNSYISASRIVRISLDDLKQKASCRIDGTVKDRYSMDEYNGHLRVATTVSGNGTYNNLYVLDLNLKGVGKVENIAPGETIYAARFNKDKGSIVTFVQVDPYYFFDLSDPKNPKIVAEIKEDGVSYYIHYIEGTDYTIGIGMDTSVTQWGGVEWKGLKVSLYRNTDGEAVNVRTLVMNGTGHSELFYNPKVFLYDEERCWFAFTFESYDYTSYYGTMKQGLAVFSFDLTASKDSDKLTFEGTLTNLGTNADGFVDIYSSSYGSHYDSFVTRGIYIGDYIYTVSNRYIAAYKIGNLSAGAVSTIDMFEAAENG